MSKIFVRAKCFRDVCILLVGLSSLLCMIGGIETKAQAEILRSKGTFAGVYHQDRWGVGRFAFYLVNPRLHEQLKAYEGKNISLEVKNSQQRVSPGPAMIQQIGRIEVLPDSPLEVKLEPNYRRALADGLVELVCYLRNRDSEPLCVTIREQLHLNLFSPHKVDNPEEPSFLLPMYNQRQMSSTRGEIVQWLNGHFVMLQLPDGRPNLEQGSQVLLQPGEEVACVARLRLAAGEHEVQIKAASEIDGERLKPTLAWFRLDVPDKLPAEVKTEPRDLPDADLEIAEVEYLPPTQFAEWANRSFTIRAARGAKRSLVACARGPEPLIAGLMRAFDQDGKELLLEIQSCYDCSSRGQPWQLTPVTRGGTSTTIGFKFHNGRPKCLKLEVLTERGLAEFSLEP